MAEQNLMTDDLLRQIISVGRADLLIGAPRIESAAEAAELVHAVRGCLRTHFPRVRAALLHAQQPGVPEVPSIVRHHWAEERTPGGLRTTHLMTTAVPPHDSGGAAVRLILATADLLQANAVVVLDPDAGDLTPERVASFAAPLQDAGVDLLTPSHPRPADAGLLVTQLARPLTGAIYGRDLREPLVPEFGASARFARHCAQRDFDVNRTRWSTHYWIAAEALSRRFTIRQVPLGKRRTPVARARPGLPVLFQQVLTSIFASIEATSGAWRAEPAVDEDPPPETGEEAIASGAPDTTGLLDTFASDVRNLNEILRRILSPDLHHALDAAASHDGGGRLPATLWADLVGEFLIAYHHRVMLPEHIVQALLPLYIARTGTFLLEHAASPPAAVETAVHKLCESFQQIRPRVVERWANPAVR